MTLGLLVILTVPLVLLVLLLGFVSLNRYITYKERIALAQMGFSLEDMNHAIHGKHGNRGVLWGGVITAMSGLALLLGLATLGTGAWLLGGLLPLFVGLGMVLIYFMTLGTAPGEGPRLQLPRSNEGAHTTPSTERGTASSEEPDLAAAPGIGPETAKEIPFVADTVAKPNRTRRIREE